MLGPTRNRGFSEAQGLSFLDQLLLSNINRNPRFQEQVDITQVDPYAKGGIGGGIYDTEDIVVEGTPVRPPQLQSGALDIGGHPLLGSQPMGNMRPPQVREMRDFEGDFGSEYEAPKKGERPGRKLSFLERLGDAFLVQSGNTPINRERLRRENISDALQGASRNPQAAYERLIRLGEPDLAQEFLKESSRIALDNRKQRQSEFEFDEEAPARQAKTQSDTSIAQQRFGNMAGRIISLADNQEKWDTVRPQVQEYLRAAGLDAMADNLPKEWSSTLYERLLTPDGLLRRDIAEQSSDDRRRGQDVSSATSRRNTDARVGATMAGIRSRESEGEKNRQVRRETAGGSKKTRTPLQTKPSAATPTRKPTIKW